MASFREEKEYFLENLAMLLSSGMGIASSLEEVSKEIRAPKVRVLVNSVLEEVVSGSSLWRALEKNKLFPKRIISLVKVGEKSGRLIENLQSAVSQQQKERLFRSRTVSAMFYPALVLFVTVVVGLGVSWLLLPRLSSVFVSLKIELPFLTRVTIGIGNFLQNYGVIFVPAVILLLVAIGIVFSKFSSDFLLLSIPGVRRLVKETELSRFGFILGSLLRAGLPVAEALDSLEESTTLKSYRKFYVHLSQGIKEGKSFASIFAFYPKIHRLFPASIIHVTSSAEQSGLLSEALIKIGQTYEIRLEDSAKNLTVALEPILLLIVWFGVVLVALSVILPIYSLIGNYNQ